MRSAPDESWARLLRAALELVNGARRKGFGDPLYTWGGGTVLMLRFAHRVSRDIDLFFVDAQWLGVLSPRLNDEAARIAAD